MTDKLSRPENSDQPETFTAGSERSFGMVLAVIFIVVALSPLLTMSDQQGTFRVWALVVAAFFAAAALTMPQALAPLNKLWTGLRLFLRKIVNQRT
jgi:hypothetical protein